MVFATTADSASKNTPKMTPAKLAPAPTRLRVYLSPITAPEASRARERNTAQAIRMPYALLNSVRAILAVRICANARSIGSLLDLACGSSRFQ